jgi:hypothetical protein
MLRAANTPLPCTLESRTICQGFSAVVMGDAS